MPKPAENYSRWSVTSCANSPRAGSRGSGRVKFSNPPRSSTKPGCELAAWKTTLAEQPLELQRRVRETLASTEGPEWCRGIDAAFKNLRRCTGLLALEEALRTQSRKMLGRKMASRFANILEYVEWDDGLGGRPRN